jgi:hypothetical protein
LLLRSSYLPLGVPNGLVIHHAQGRLLHNNYTPQLFSGVISLVNLALAAGTPGRSPEIGVLGLFLQINITVWRISYSLPTFGLFLQINVIV